MAKTSNFDARENFSKNLLINSNLEFWQRNTSFTGLGSNQIYTADRLQWAGGTITATLSCSRVSISGTNSSIVPKECNYAARFGVSVAQPSLGSGASAAPWIKVEGYDAKELHSSTQGFVFSFYVRAFRTGSYSVTMSNAAFDRNILYNFTVTASDTWQRVVLKVPNGFTSGTWNTTNGIGMYVRLWMAANPTGSIFTGTGTWQANNQPIVANQVNALQTTNDYLEVTGFMLYAGQEEQDFVTRENSYSKELQLCQRYFEKSYPLSVVLGTPTSTGSTTNFSGNGSTNRPYVTIYFKQQKRTAPGAVFYNPRTGSTTNPIWDFNTPTTDYSIAGLGTEEYSMNIAPGGTPPTSSALGVHWAADAEL